MLIGVIPARSKSKRIKNKNLKLLGGKPIISWTIEAAKKSKIFDKIIVSTDSLKIAKIARKYGAEAPFLRPDNLSDDHTSIKEVMKHSVQYFNKKKFYKYFCLLYATAPFILPKDLIKGFNKIKSRKNIDFVISVNEIDNRILRGLIEKRGKLNPIFKNNVMNRSQDLPKVYLDSAHFVFGKNSSWIKNKHPFLSKSSFIKIPSLRSIDIDNISDFKELKKRFKQINFK